MQNTIKNSIAVAKVWVSIMRNKIYVSVSEIAIFLNVLYGTHTITGQKVNEMLEMAGYQRKATDEEQQNPEFLNSKYINSSKGKDFFEIDTLVKDNEEIHRLLWKARVILDIFQIDLKANYFEMLDSFYSGAYEYNLINTEKENIDDNVFDINVSFINEEMN